VGHHNLMFKVSG